MKYHFKFTKKTNIKVNKYCLVFAKFTTWNKNWKGNVDEKEREKDKLFQIYMQIHFVISIHLITLDKFIWSVY